jgi:hypothetical protein
MTYAEAAELGARVLGADLRLIEPVATRSVIPNAEGPVQHTTLDVKPLPHLLGVNVPEVVTSVCSAFRWLAGGGAARSLRLCA